MASKLSAELLLDIKKFRKSLQNAQGAVRGFGGRSGRGGGKAMSSGIAAGITASAAIVAGALVAVVTAAAAVAGYQAGKIVAKSIQTAAENEKFQMRFEVLTGSREAGNDVLNTLREDALRTGIAVGDMADNVGKFMAFGFNPDEAIKLNKGILDVGGSVGLTTRDMKLLGVALSQVAAKGVANMEELRQQIAEKGIPIFKALEQQLGVTGAELSKMIQEGKVSAETVMQLFTDVPDGKGPFAKFAGGAEKMASTFEGKVNRIKTGWQEFLRIMGDPIIDAISPLLDKAIGMMDNLREHATKIGTAVADVISAGIAVGQVLMGMDWASIGNLFLSAMTLALKEFANLLNKTLAGASQFMVVYLVEGARTFLSTLQKLGSFEFWSGMFNILISIAGRVGSTLALAVGKALMKVGEALGPAGGMFTGAGEGIVADAEANNKKNDEQLKNGVDQILPTTKDLMGDYADRVAKAAEGFIDAFEETSDVFDTSGEKGKLSEFMAEVKETFRKLKEEREERTRNRNRSGADGEEDGAGAGAAGKGGVTAGLNSRVSQAINTISGRSAFAVIASENAKIAKNTKDTADAAKETARNTKPKPGQPNTAPVPAGGTFV